MSKSTYSASQSAVEPGSIENLTMRASELAGFVVDATSNDGIGDAEIFASWSPFPRVPVPKPADGEPTGYARSAGDGSFALALPDEVSSVLVRASGYVAARVPLPLALEAELLEIELEPESIIRGRVVDAAHVPVAGAALRLVARDVEHDSAFAITCSTATDGSFELRGVARGRHALAVDQRDYAERVVDLEISGDHDIGVVMLAPAILLVGEVRASSTRTSGTITLRGGPRVLRAYVDDSGHFEFPRLGFGDYVLDYHRGRSQVPIERNLVVTAGPIQRIELAVDYPDLGVEVRVVR
ncbi:MAG: carboxypeptidase-like regulatory domain-containing protein [Planctomycetota bacterium]